MSISENMNGRDVGMRAQRSAKRLQVNESARILGEEKEESWGQQKYSWRPESDTNRGFNHNAHSFMHCH